MRHPADAVRRRRRVAIDAAMLFVILVLVVQMWLLTASLESFLAGHTDVALPGFLVSVVLFAASVVVYRLVIRLDRAPEPEDRRPGHSGPWLIG